MAQKRIEIVKKPTTKETNQFIEKWVSGVSPNNMEINALLKRTTIYLPEKLHKELKIKAANQQTTMTDLIIEALEKHLK